jgi:UDP-N-acetylmuramoyl-tripeptide--D-alanyl-D-alanine ligase
VPAIVVEQPVAALGRLASAHLHRLPDTHVVGVTGSSGKTTTKDLLAGVLARSGPTVAPVGSFNTDVGLPLTVLRAGPETRHLVLEYGARAVGHIAGLCAIAQPRVAVVLNVGSAHLGEFGSREAIALAKQELVASLPPDVVAVLNADDERVAAMGNRTAARVVTFGVRSSADVRATDVRLDRLGRPSFDTLGQRFELGIHGAHQVTNALATIVVGLEAGLRVSEIADALREFRPVSRWRMEFAETSDGVTVINDAYNANPESVRAALDTLAAVAAGRATDGGRSIAVLGELRELGAATHDCHAELGRYASALGIDRVVAVGEGASTIAEAAGERGMAVADIEHALTLIRPALRSGDVVLVKASRAAGLERLAGELLTPGVPA